jgi:hypothetical protein
MSKTTATPNGAQPPPASSAAPTDEAKAAAGAVPPSAPTNESTIRVIEERTVRGHELLYKRPAIRMNVALVMLSPKGTYRVALPNCQPTLGELMWRRIRTLYEVDLGEHDSVIEDDVPSTGDAFPFHAVLDLRWRVEDPVGVVKRHLATADDVVRAIRPELRDRMRRITREFDVVDAATAEARVNQSLSAMPIGSELGLWTRCWVRLTLEDAARTHAANRREVQRQIVLERETQELRRLQEQNNHELMQTRVAFYRAIIAAGDIDQFAVRIAQHPGEISSVMEALRDERNTGRRNAIDFFSRLAESGLIERHQISDTVKETVDWLNESVGRVLDSAASRKDGPAPRTEADFSGAQRVPRSAELPAAPLPGGASLPATAPQREAQSPTETMSDSQE